MPEASLVLAEDATTSTSQIEQTLYYPQAMSCSESTSGGMMKSFRKTNSAGSEVIVYFE